MHGRDPKLAETGDRIQEFMGIRFNGITFRVYLCLLIVFVPSILGHLPLLLGSSIIRGIVSGGLGIVISIWSAFLLSHIW